MTQEYKITRLNQIHHGIDGSDEFFHVECDEPINRNDLLDKFSDEFYYETQQEAGGYFCRTFEVYLSKYKYNAVVKVEHRYDV